MSWPQEFECHLPWMREVARSRLGDAHAVDDVIQDVTLTIIQQRIRPKQPDRVRAWLYQIVTRRAVDYLRKRYRHERVMGNYSEAKGEESDQSDGWKWILATEQRQTLKQALAGLEPEDRDMVLLKYGEDWTYRRLAERFGVSERVIEYRLLCAKRALRHSMKSLMEPDRESRDEDK